MRSIFFEFRSRIYRFILISFGAFLNFGSYYCCYCEKRSPFFLSYKGGSSNLPALMKVLDITGSDVNHHSCPKCQSHDRERHLKLYFDGLGLKKLVTNSRVLHFAPERWFSKYIQEATPSYYVKADLHPASADIRHVDVLAMDFEDQSFDLVIANHVLEHVIDDAKALTELNRVLRPGGFAVLQTPYSEVLLQKFEDKGIEDHRARLQAYGQEDHLRLYGRDIFGYIESFGFKSYIQRHESALSSYHSEMYGVNVNEPLFLFKKI